MRRRTVADLVREHRESAGLSVVDAARRAGVGRSTWTEIEQAARPMKKGATLGKVAQAIDLDPLVLLTAAGLRQATLTNGDEQIDVSDLVVDIGRRLDKLEMWMQRLDAEVQAAARPAAQPESP